MKIKFFFPFSFGCRFDSLVSRCSITNTNVQFDQVAAKDEIQEDFSAVESNCSVPIVRLNSDILETESLNLLTKGAYVDSLLTKLPVRSLGLSNMFFPPSLKIFHVFFILESQHLILSSLY